MGFPQETNIYYYKLSEAGQAKTRKQRRENTCDLEEVNGMQCLITEPTRITPTSETLLDVILTNKSNLFRTECSFNPEICDHHLIYGMLK